MQDSGSLITELPHRDVPNSRFIGSARAIGWH